LEGLAPVRKVDPKYPPELIEQNVEGEVILYAIIRADGSVDSIQLVQSVDPQLDANAKNAFAQWKFRPATKGGAPVELEAIVHVPFRIPDNR
jgi:protein TonB